MRGDKDDAFDKCSARGVDRATVVIGERNLNLSRQHYKTYVRCVCTGKLCIDNAILPCLLLILLSQ